jgi:hypothetical protein
MTSIFVGRSPRKAFHLGEQILTDSVVFNPMFRMSSERIGRETRGLTRGHICHMRGIWHPPFSTVNVYPQRRKRGLLTNGYAGTNSRFRSTPPSFVARGPPSPEETQSFPPPSIQGNGPKEGILTSTVDVEYNQSTHTSTLPFPSDFSATA